MLIVGGWFADGGGPSKDSKKDPLPKQTRYKFLDTFLGDVYQYTFKRMNLVDLKVMPDTKFVGPLLTLREVVQVVNLKEPFNPFFVTKMVAEKLKRRQAEDSNTAQRGIVE